MGARGSGQPSIEETVERVTADVAGVSERAHERSVVMNTSGHTQEMVVGEVTDDNVAILRQ